MKKYSSLDKKVKFLSAEYRPTDRDVVCGRGKAYAKLPGNKMFMNILRANLDRYVAAHKRMEKTAVVSTLVDQVLTTGACFVRHDTKTRRYCQLSALHVHEKVGHALRDLLKSGRGTLNGFKDTVEMERKRRASAVSLLRPDSLQALEQEFFNCNDTKNLDEQLDDIALLDFTDQESLPVAPVLIEIFEASDFDGDGSCRTVLGSSTSSASSSCCGDHEDHHQHCNENFPPPSAKI